MKNDYVLAIAVAAAVIVIGVFFGWYNNRVVLTYPYPHFHYTAEPHNPLSFLSNWDGPDYLSIVKSGYSGLRQANFFPLYPIVIIIVHLIISSVLDSALLVSWASFVGALYFYIKIVKRLFNVSETSELLRALTFFVLFPTGVFLFATYTESLDAMLSLGAIYFALERRWWLAAPLAMLASATHITGMAAVVAVAVILWEQKERWYKILASLAIGSLGLLAYMIFLLRRFHDPLAFLHSQEQIHGWLRSGFSNLLQTVDAFDVLFIVLLGLTMWYWWRRRKSFAVYSLLFLLIPFVGRQFGGFNRYALMAFPLQFMLYDFFRTKKAPKAAFPYVAALLAVAWTYVLLQYAGGYVGS